MTFTGICYAGMVANDFVHCLYKKYSIEADESDVFAFDEQNAKLVYFCDCTPGKDNLCVAEDFCAKKGTPEDLLNKYKDCGVYASFESVPLPGDYVDPNKKPENGQIGGQCALWRYCYGEARCENYKCVPHPCKKEGEVPNGLDDQCCLPMVTKQGSPCKLLNTGKSSTCNSHRQCQLDNDNGFYVCCYKYGREKPPVCTLNKDCETIYTS